MVYIRACVKHFYLGSFKISRNDHSAWICHLKRSLIFQANAIGRSAKTVREFLEKHYSEEVSASEKESIKLALKALLEVVQSGSKNMEIAVMRRGEPLKVKRYLLKNEVLRYYYRERFSPPDHS